MFFRVHVDSKTSVTGIIGIDHHLYWIASDVAKLFGRTRLPKVETDFCLGHVLPLGWDMTTFGYDRHTRLITPDRLEEICTLKGQLNSSTTLFSNWIQYENNSDEEESGPTAIPINHFSKIIEAPLFSIRLHRMPEVRITRCLRGEKFSLSDLTLLLCHTAAKVFRKWYKIEGRKTGITVMIPPEEHRFIDDLSSNSSNEDPQTQSDSNSDMNEEVEDPIDIIHKNLRSQGLNCYPSVITTLVTLSDGSVLRVPELFIAIQGDAEFVYKLVKKEEELYVNSEPTETKLEDLKMTHLYFRNIDFEFFISATKKIAVNTPNGNTMAIPISFIAICTKDPLKTFHYRVDQNDKASRELICYRGSSGRLFCS